MILCDMIHSQSQDTVSQTMGIQLKRTRNSGKKL